MTQRELERRFGSAAVLSFGMAILIALGVPFAPTSSSPVATVQQSATHAKAPEAQRSSRHTAVTHQAPAPAVPAIPTAAPFLMMLSGLSFWAGVVFVGLWHWRRKIRVRAEIWAEARRPRAANSYSA